MISQPDQSAQSALAIPVPEVEEWVGPYRAGYDPSAAAGMPAHITVLYPFLPPDEANLLVQERIAECCARHERFEFRLNEIRRFNGGVIYLAPEPDQPFRRLTTAIWEGWPLTPPYGGRYSKIVPHLTVAQVGDKMLCDRIAIEFSRAAHGRLPIDAHADRVAFFEKRGGRWRIARPHVRLRTG
jgi:2'-5' RNA ligase